MNVKKALSIISKSISISLYQMSADDSHWISNGKAVYNLGNFPWCESEDELAAVLGFTNKQKDSHVFAINNGVPFISGSESIIGLLHPEELCITNELGTTAFFTRNGETYAVNAALLKPFDTEDTTFDLIELADGTKFIKVNYGFFTAGYLRTAKISSDIHRRIKDFVKVLNGISPTNSQEEQDDDA